MVRPFLYPAAAAAMLAAIASSQYSFGQPPPEPPSAPAPAADAPNEGADGAEVYTRGPLHEAFAAPVLNNPVEQPVITKRPPDAVDEIPPDQKPEGNNVTWIPGYWAWDDSLDDFLWVSGVWRDAPPYRRWVPGYWEEVEGGYRWISGIWTASDAAELAYLPAPPASLEEGPPSASPGDDYFWVPGSWEYVNADYKWRPGYWTPFYDDWTWVPAQYSATPGGVVYVPGYWDYSFEDRGIAFAPVRFNNWAGGAFTPVAVLNTWDNFFVHLFVSPRFGSYVYGDYYGPSYASSGIVPWYSFHNGRRGYDPLYVHNQHLYGDSFARRVHGWHDYYASHEDHRPRATLRQQQQFLGTVKNEQIASLSTIGSRLNDAAKADRQPFRFAHLSKDDRTSYINRSKEFRDFSQNRVKFEREARIDGGRREGDSPRTGRHAFKLPPTRQTAERPDRDRTPDATDTKRPESPNRNGPGRDDPPQGRNRDDRNDRDPLPNTNRPGRDTLPTRQPPQIPSSDGKIDRDRPRPPRDGAVPGAANPKRSDRMRNFPEVPGAGRDDDRTPGTPRDRLPQTRAGEGRNGPGGRPMPDVKSPQPAPKQPAPNPNPGAVPGNRPGVRPNPEGNRPPAVNPQPQPKPNPGAAPGNVPGARPNPGGNRPPAVNPQPRPNPNPGANLNPGAAPKPGGGAPGQPGGGGRPSQQIRPEQPRPRPTPSAQPPASRPNLPAVRNRSAPQQPSKAQPRARPNSAEKSGAPGSAAGRKKKHHVG